MSAPNLNAYKIAGELGKLLERQDVRDTGVALGMVLAQFILITGTDDRAIDNGIQSIADDAKLAARKLRMFRQ